MRTFAFTLEYDGSGFEGWQRQPEGHRSVQAELERALEEIVGHPVQVRGAGRTDAGVHAQAQLASADLRTRLDPATLRRALNAHLPADLVAHGVALAEPGWNPRFAAHSKHYRYSIWNAPGRSPLRASRSHHVPQPLDLPAMEAAAVRLQGRHDFACFQAAGTAVHHTVRELHGLTVGGGSGSLVWIDARGDGFLRHMVRNLAGTLIEVGLGRRSPESMAALLASRDRRRAGPTAPAHGLVLVSVDAVGAPRLAPGPSARCPADEGASALG